MWKRRPAVVALCLLTLHIAGGQQTSPQFQTIPSNTTVGSVAKILACTASGNPIPTISWYRDGTLVNVQAEAGLTVSAGGLSVSNQAMEGMYQCQASNGAGTVRSVPAYLQRAVWDPGFNTIMTTSSSIPRFSYQVLSCRMPASSHPPATVSWDGPQTTSNHVGVTKDGRLVFSAYQPVNQNFETYTCSVANPVTQQEQSSQTFNLVNAPPSSLVIPGDIEIRPVDQTIVAGKTLMLECFPSGNPTPTVTWSKGGSTVMSGGRIQLLQSAWQLQITGVESGDAGTYTCSAMQEGSSPITSSATIQVIDPPQIISSFQAVVANVTQSFTISCSAQGTPPLQWVWYRDATSLTQSARVSFDMTGSTSVLTATSLEESDGGVYQCVVSQPSTGRSHAHNELVDVQAVRPMFLPSDSAFPDQLVLEGTDVSLPCAATGFPIPTFQWYRNQRNEQRAVDLSNSRYSIPPSGTGNGSLSITQVIRSDSSPYFCEAMNSAGAINDRNRILTVISAPIISQTPPTSFVADIGADVTLNCAVTSREPVTISYRWTRGGVLVGNDNRPDGTLVISSVREGTEDSGSYECSAIMTGTAGIAAPLIIEVGSTILTVQEPAQPPSKPNIAPPTEISPTSFRAHWTPPSDSGGLPIVSYTMEVRPTGSSFCTLNSEPWTVVATGLDTRNVLVDRNVFPGIGYEYRVTVFTALYNNTSDSATLTTPNAAPQAPPTNVMANTLNSTAIAVTWTPPTSCLTFGDVLRGYFLYISSPTATPPNMIPVNGSTHTLIGLLPATTYTVTMTTRNDQGESAASGMVMATTMEGPSEATPQPVSLNSRISSSNSSAVTLTWTPPTDTPLPIVNYTIKYIANDGTERTITLPPTQSSHTIGRLSPGFPYMFRLQAVYSDGTSSEPVTIPATLTEEDTGILTQPWFYAAVAGGGAVFLIIAVVLIACICYQCCKIGRYNVQHVKRATSGVSNASSHFAPYQRKAKKKQTTAQVTVHQSPTTSHQSGDYAIPTLQRHLVQETQQQQQQQHLNHHQQQQKPQDFMPPRTKYTPPYGPGVQPLGSNISSTGPPSVANFTSSAMSSPEFDTRNDDLYPHHNHPGTQQRLQVSAINPTHQPHHHGNYTSDDYSSTTQDSPYLDDQRHLPQAEQMRRSSATASKTFQDTLQRVHTPPMSTRGSEHQFGRSYLAKDLSDEVREPPFNAGEFLNARGNMLGIDKNNPSDNSGTGQKWNHGNNQSKPRQNHMTKMFSGNIGRSESLMSTESSNSLDYKGPSQFEEDPHKLMAEEARYQAPTPQVKRAKQPYDKSQDFSDKYLMRADEIRMKELNKGRGTGREETDGYPTGHAYNRNWTQEEREQPFQQGAVPIMVSGPQVHLSHSTAVQNGYNLSGEYDSDRQYYDVPPNREEKQFIQSQHSIYKCPAPTYAAPPPPSSDEEQLLPPSNAHTLQPKTHQENRLHILPLPPSSTLPLVENSRGRTQYTDVRTSTGRTTLTDGHVPPKVPGTIPKASGPVPKASGPIPKASGPVPKASGPVPKAPGPIPKTSGPVLTASGPIPKASGPVPKASGPVPKASGPKASDPIPNKSGPFPKTPGQVPTGSGPVPVPSPSFPGSSIGPNKATGTWTSSQQTSTFHPSANTSHTKSSTSVSHASGHTTSTTNPSPKQPSLLESSSSSSISSNWSIERMGNHFEKLAKGFDNLLDPLDEERPTIHQQEQEGTVGVNWDMPSGPHMINGHHSKPQKPQVAQKSHLVKKHSNGMPRGFRSGGRGNSSHSNNGYSADEEGPGITASGKKRVKVPEPSLRVDPRKPTLKVKKVQGSAWRQETVNKAIQSSSEDSDDSACSDDTVVAGNTDTLRSAHV